MSQPPSPSCVTTCDTAVTPRLRMQLGRDSAVATLRDPATALPFLLRADFPLPRGIHELGTARLPPR